MHKLIAPLLFALLFASEATAQTREADPSFLFGSVLFQDDFRQGLAQWQVETERPGKVVASLGAMNIDVPAGATVWFKQEIIGPVAIVFDATVISANGVNDRVSDLNCFWMARNHDD